MLTRLLLFILMSCRIIEGILESLILEHTDSGGELVMCPAVGMEFTSPSFCLTDKLLVLLTKELG
jgi:hypothetical protein